MKNNEIDKPIIRPNGKCVDIVYLIITSLFFFGLLGFAIASFNLQNLNELSMPRNVEGVVCSKINSTLPMPYLDIKGPQISKRQCVRYCQETEPDHRLGGLCISPRVQSILKQSGEYDQYIQPKINALNRIKIVPISLAVSIGLALIITVISELSLKCCTSNVYTNIFILFSIVVGITTLYFLLSSINFILWICLCFLFTLYFLYVALYKICRKNSSTSKITKQSDTVKGTFMKRLLMSMLSTCLVIGFGCLLIFQYLAFISQSPFYQWTSPNLFAQVTQLTWKQILVIVQGLYFVSFTSALNQYLVGSLTSNNLGIRNALFSLLRCHLGSLCKLSLIRLLLFVPIFVFTLFKPFQQQKCASCCHCLCGFVLNFCRKYSLPLLSYQSTMKQTIELQKAADRLHYQTHINEFQYSNSYIDKMAILVVVSCGAAASVLIFQNQYGLKVNLITLCISVIFSIWASNSFASSWIHAKQGAEVRKICEANRNIGTHIEDQSP